ncbi:MAG: hypothetical protein HYX68_22525 [Planctomycetes bacterium]|nr:hypothetical protein [Planctomycetota bacterium]
MRFTRSTAMWLVVAFAAPTSVYLGMNQTSFGRDWQGGVTGAQEKNPDQPRPERRHVGFRECVRCHNSGVTGDIVLPGGAKLALMKEQWVLYKEYPIWAEKDKHGQAYAVLLNERSKSMGKLLGVAEVHRDPRCLACHTGFPLSRMKPGKDGLVHRDLEKDLDINLGVSCEGCHGPSGDYRSDKVVLLGWMDPHQIAPKPPYEQAWRFKSPREKQSQYGFYDVRSPASKTKLCVSCHLGDVELGRIVTHEMFAAGHPPLPGFEVETFTQQMPGHWVEFSAKSKQVRELFVEHTKDELYARKAYKRDGLPRTRSMLVGAVITASEYLRQVSQLADEEVKSPVRRPAWPEFAAFDCYACHHELKSPSWRQERKPAGKIPGRPALHDWPFALARIALKNAGVSRGDVDAPFANLRDAIYRKPFGDQLAASKAARLAAAWLREKGLEIEKKPLDKDDGIAILKDIIATGSRETLDYESARQLVWAYNVIDKELRSEYPGAKKVHALLEPMGKDTLLLDLRKYRKATIVVGGQRRTTEEVDLHIVLPFVSSYQPAEFRKRFGAIGALLK